MAPTLKHGGHRITLTVQNTGAATGVDIWPYDATGWLARWNYDPTQEAVVAGVVSAGGVVSGYSALSLSHYNSAGTLVDQIALQGLTTVNHVSQDITGQAAGTGRTLQQGWLLSPGDVIELSGTSAGAASSVAVTLDIGVPS